MMRRTNRHNPCGLTGEPGSGVEGQLRGGGCGVDSSPPSEANYMYRAQQPYGGKCKIIPELSGAKLPYQTTTSQ